MGKIVINHENVTEEKAKLLVNKCFFGAIEYVNGKLDINSACKTCKICVRACPEIMSYIEEEDTNTLNKEAWKGVCVYTELDDDGIHPVVLELIGKAKELGNKINHPVYAIMIATKKEVKKYAETLLSYGIDKCFIYEDDRFSPFNVELHAQAMIDFIDKIKPSSILYGGTSIGRSLAPKIAAHYRTGLTADCTFLDMKENSDLIQVRPAFGGNIMAQIICTKTRPQMSTVRYKIFPMPEKTGIIGKKEIMSTKNIKFETHIKTISHIIKEKVQDISASEVVVAIGRAFKNEEEIALAREFAEAIGGVLASTRPLVESGLIDPKCQIGLSGKTVAPKLLITLGVSGQVQFTAGMRGSNLIISVNKDPNAPIFDVAHYGIVDDCFKIIPTLLQMIKKDSKEGED